MDPYTHALTQGEFYLQGELVYWGRTETVRKEITEFHKDGDYQIVYPDRTYWFLNGQYHVRDERYESGQTDVPLPVSDPEEMRDVQEMFHQASVVSGCGLSDALCVSRGRSEIPGREGDRSVSYDCRTYLLKGKNRDAQLEEPELVRLYFCADVLCAISTWNNKLIFYVSEFSTASPLIEKDAGLIQREWAKMAGEQADVDLKIAELSEKAREQNEIPT